MSIALIILATLLAVASGCSVYLGSRNQIWLTRPLDGRVSLVAAGLGLLAGIMLLAAVISLPAAVFAESLVMTMVLTGLPFLRLLPGRGGRR